MNKTRSVFSIAVVALLVATPAVGQLTNFPLLALGRSDDGATSIGAGWGRGLNTASSKLNSFGAGVHRTMESVSFGVYGGYVIDAAGPDASEIGLGGSVSYNLPTTASVDFALQGGIEWMSVDNVPDNTTLLNFPIGISVQGSTTAGSLEIPMWIMPRVQFIRSSTGDVSDTETDVGMSGGVSAVTEGGWGLGVSADWQARDGVEDAVFRFGAAVFYRLP